VEAEELALELRGSLARQDAILRASLVLNPVENFPVPEDLAVVAGPSHGLYTSDKRRTRAERSATDHQFAGRRAMERDHRRAYAAWAGALGAADATLRLLSGLHAHIVLFMAMSRAGQRVLLLPVEAGGHLSGRKILERLGLEVVEMVPDTDHMAVDIERTLERCAVQPPDFVFFDRSEGLVVEDVSALTGLGATSVYDASQYLTNIIAADHPLPFAQGFDLLVSSVHKNFPGPQKALLATRVIDERWVEILRGVSTYVSNFHATSTYAATLSLGRTGWLTAYSKRMLTCAVRLEEELAENGVPVVRRANDLPPTHHVWIREASRDRAFETFEALERCRILTNFRKLPYSLGHGLRLGLSAAARTGLEEGDVPALAAMIADIRRDGSTSALRHAAREFNMALWERRVQTT
jgi:glycine hydroxymethyltransferase